MPLTRDEIVTMTLNRLGNKSRHEALRVVAKEEIKLVQQRLEQSQKLPWFLLSEDSFTTTKVNEPRLTVPKDHLLDYEQGALWLIRPQDGEVERLEKYDLDRMRKKYSSVTPNQPKRYALTNLYYRLNPTPDAVYTMQLMYYQADIELGLHTVNKWTTYAADVLVGELGLILAGQYVNDQARVDDFSSYLEAARSRMYMKTEARDHTDRDYEMDVA